MADALPIIYIDPTLDIKRQLTALFPDYDDSNLYVRGDRDSTDHCRQMAEFFSCGIEDLGEMSNCREFENCIAFWPIEPVVGPCFSYMTVIVTKYGKLITTGCEEFDTDIDETYRITPDLIAKFRETCPPQSQRTQLTIDCTPKELSTLKLSVIRRKKPAKKVKTLQ